MPHLLENKRVAFLATDGFEESELFEPLGALDSQGATITIISLHPGEIKGWRDKEWGESITVEATVSDCNPDDFDALVLPGGVMNPDQLRVNGEAVAFARRFVESGKPIGAICHGPWLLVETGGVSGRQMTSWPSLKTDLTNAGAQWVDEEVVVDRGLVTSRRPSDLPAFNRKLIEEISEGPHEPGPSGN